VAVAALAGASAVQAAVVGTSLSINFVGGAGTDPPTPGQTLLATDVAGLIPSANWNNAADASGTLNTLVADINGVATPIPGSSFTWATNNNWSTDAENNTSQFINPADEKMMSGYADIAGPTTANPTPVPRQFVLSGLPNGVYDVIVYTMTAVNNRDSGNIAVNGVNKKSITPLTPSTTFIPGGGPGGADNVGGLPGNFNLYPAVAVTGGTITFDMNAVTFRTAINGIQVYDPATVPEPAALGFVGLCGLGLLARRRKA
jgi:MYXO-CTERM domain-containing protein